MAAGASEILAPSRKATHTRSGEANPRAPFVAVEAVGDAALELVHRHRVVKPETEQRHLTLYRCAATNYSVIEQKDHDGPDYSDKHAVEIETSNALRTELREKEAPHEGADDTENDIQEDALTRLIDDLACDEPSD